MGETSLTSLMQAAADHDFHAPADTRTLRVNTTEQCGIDDVQDAIQELGRECGILRDTIKDRVRAWVQDGRLPFWAPAPPASVVRIVVSAVSPTSISKRSSSDILKSGITNKFIKEITNNIEVFSTGGIGGVHKQAEQTFDISQDILALSQVSMLVVSSGAGSRRGAPFQPPRVRKVGGKL